MSCEWSDKIFAVKRDGFDQLALDIFAFQFRENAVYQAFARQLQKTPDRVHAVRDIPFLPIGFFKSHEVVSGNFAPDIGFLSSGTTGSARSRHLVKDISIYEHSFLSCFELYYGRPGDYCIIGLLPSYIENGDSSLVYMTDKLIARSGHPRSGFYLGDYERLAAVLRQNEEEEVKTILLGVTYALLDFAERYAWPLRFTTIMETGGMKGRQRELTREEVHELLGAAFTTSSVHSEYGMTELLSQAYAREQGFFRLPPWMQVCLREEDDPLSIHTREGSSGLINVIDLANVYSCSFIATDDAGRLQAGHLFEVLGRRDNSDLRGCSLLTA